MQTLQEQRMRAIIDKYLPKVEERSSGTRVDPKLNAAYLNICEAKKRLSPKLKSQLENAIDELLITGYSSSNSGNEAEWIISHLEDSSFPKMNTSELAVAADWIRVVYESTSLTEAGSNSKIIDMTDANDLVDVLMDTTRDVANIASKVKNFELEFVSTQQNKKVVSGLKDIGKILYNLTKDLQA